MANLLPNSTANIPISFIAGLSSPPAHFWKAVPTPVPMTTAI